MNKKRFALLSLIALMLTGCNPGQDKDSSANLATAEKGDMGDKGTLGKDGTSLLNGNGSPSADLGKDGDSYIDTSTWDFYTKKDGKWVKSGNIKGEGAATTYVPCIFYNYDGTKLYEFYYAKGSDIVYDGPTPVKKEKDQDGKEIPWTFVGWDKSLEDIQKPTAFTAQFECLYTCDFVNYDGSILYSTKVNRGEDAVYKGETPAKPDTKDGDTTIKWTFTGWDRPLTDIRADTKFTAQFDSPNAIKCTFLNYDGTLLGYSYCGKGGKVSYTGETPTKADDNVGDGTVTRYTFSGWDKPLTNIQSPTTFTAQYETSTAYECKFVNYDGSLLYTTYVLQNGYAEYKGSEPVREDSVGSRKNDDGTTNVTEYTFTGWDRGQAGITQPTTFTAQYDSRQYSGYQVVFQGPDGTELSREYVGKGENASYPTECVSKYYSYNKDNVTMFAGFDKPLDNVTSDLVVKAKTITIPRTQNGEWPQTQVTDASLLSALDSITVRDGQGYVSYNGEKYARDGSLWRKVEPIEWRFLSQEGKNVRFVSEKVLTDHVWNETEHSGGIYPNNYKYSDIRKWLNSDFLQQAFYYDPSLIQTAEVDNSPESTGTSSNRYACENTDDKVYLLSYSDVRNADYGFDSRESRVAYDVEGKGSRCWLRSPLSRVGSGAYCVDYAGGVNYYFSSVSLSFGVRPALTMKLE